ncbi:hypothetical protein GOP47_0028458 [Adiantum capillus-veneris]|nr:hypothetical protein GOP47_0028458 [Adiantum capillus-veneris]
MACTLEGGLQDTQNLIAGLCTVEFVSTGSYQRSSLEAWTYNLALTTAKYFATDYCAQNLKVIFYGIEQNAACAAHAFAATFNRVSNLAADFVPKKLLEEGDRIEIDRIKQYPNTKASRWQQQEQTTSPAFVGASANWVRSGIAFMLVCSARSIWLEGVPKNKAMVKKYGYKAVKALALHSRKVWKAFLENKKWTVVGSRLKDPVLP